MVKKASKSVHSALNKLNMKKGFTKIVLLVIEIKKIEPTPFGIEYSLSQTTSIICKWIAKI